MTGMLNDMLAREHVQDLLCEAEAYRSGARARTEPRGLGRALAGFLARWRGGVLAGANASTDDG
jgi:hypothetical protein